MIEKNFARRRNPPAHDPAAAEEAEAGGAPQEENLRASLFESVAQQEIERFFETAEANFNGSTKRKHCML